MTVARHYVMTAAEGQADDLRAALTALATRVRRLDGCEGVMLFRDARTPTRFTFIECWTSADAYHVGGKQLGKEALAPVMAALASPPEGRDLEQLPL